jgi:drug/metabolite transporter (DMT)-like permease
VVGNIVFAMGIPLTSLYSFGFFGEVLTWDEAGGAGLIFLSVVLVTMAKTWKVNCMIRGTILKKNITN